MIKIKYIILFLIIIYLFINIKKNKENFKNNKVRKFNLKNTEIIIKNKILYLMNKKDRAIYSKFNIDSYDSDSLYFNKIFQNINKEKNKKNILMLGFGFGGIPLKISKHKDILNIDCIDTDKELFKYFKKIFPNYSKKINLFHNDANSYLYNTNKKYDIIIDDVFDGYIKIELDYNEIKKKLNKNGKLYINNYDIEKKNFLKKIIKIFGSNYSKNHILMNGMEQTVYTFTNN